MKTTFLNKAQAVSEIASANLPQELTAVFLDLVKNSVDNTEVSVTPVNRDVMSVVFQTTANLQFVKELDCATVCGTTVSGVTAVTILKKRN